MISMRKTLIIGVLSLLFAISCSARGTDGVIVHISSGPETDIGSHRIIMGLNLAYNAANTGRKVLVFFDVHGVSVPLKTAVDVTHASHAEGIPSAQEALRLILDKGGRIMVCPACLQQAGYSADDLIDGAEMGKIDTLFQFTDGRIITLDF